MVSITSAAFECKNTYSYYSSPEPTDYPLDSESSTNSNSATNSDSDDVDNSSTYSYYTSPDESLVNSPHQDAETAGLSQAEIDEIYLERMEEEYAKREGGC